jgi:hypothetical protein
MNVQGINPTWMAQTVWPPIKQPDFDEVLVAFAQTQMHVRLTFVANRLLVVTWRPESWWVN